jgi:hypothetical protein
MMQRTASLRDEQDCQAWRDDITANFTRDRLHSSTNPADGRTLNRHIWSCTRGKRLTETTPLERGD